MQQNPEEFYRRIILIRSFEERLLELFSQGKLRGTAHVCIGQEASAVGVCSTLADGDAVVSNHRGHGHMIARGADIAAVFAEMTGREDGYSRGRGGSQHLAAFATGFYGSNGITAGGLPVAAGIALGMQLENNRKVCVAFCGDGATAQGAFHEALNLAAVWKLPLVVVVENNAYAMSTPTEATCPDGNIVRRASGYGITGVSVDGADVIAVRRAAAGLVQKVRSGEGPQFLECQVSRHHGHSRSDSQHYRDESEKTHALEHDPVGVLRAYLLSQDVSEERLEQIEREVLQEISEAEEFAFDSPVLDVSAVMDDVFAPLRPNDRLPVSANNFSGEVTYAGALNRALSDSLGDERVVVMGEDIGRFGGAFRVTDGLLAQFGAQRVRDCPISENGFMGAGVGAALYGLKPVVEIMFMDFLLLALDQLANHAAKFHYILGRPVPLTVRTPAGGRRGYGATHSQCFENLLLSIPGIKIFTPATVQDAYDLLLEAIDEPNPVVVVEHKLLYGKRGALECGNVELQLSAGKARICRAGTDATVITFSHMLYICLDAAELLAQEGIEVEVLDLRTLRPLDMQTVKESVCRTGKALVAEEGMLCGGVGAEITAQVQQECFGYLDAPVLRAGAADAPLAASQIHEKALLPQVADIVQKIRMLCTGDFL